MRKSSFLKTLCIVFMFCVMTAVASLAQTFTTLASFGRTGGSEPMAGLVQATNGNLVWDNRGWRGGAKWSSRHGLHSHPKWHADDAAHLRRSGGQASRSRVGPGRQWELVRDNA